MRTSSHKRTTPQLWYIALVVVSAQVFCSKCLLAAPIGINLATSSVTVTHDPLPGELPSHSAGGAGTVAVSMPLHVDVSGPDNSAGKGVVQPIVSPFVFGLNILEGTGISQLDPAPNVGPSVLRIDFSVDYLFDAGGFPLGWFEFATFPLISIAEPGDTVTFHVIVNFFSATLGGLIGPGVELDFVNAGGGLVATKVEKFNPALAAIPAFDTIKMVGSVVFTADNQTEPASIFLSANGGINSVPEPAVAALLAAGLVGLGLSHRNRRKAGRKASPWRTVQDWLGCSVRQFAGTR